MDISKEHTFVICAYKESPYLEECILSLKRQKAESTVIMATSTPNEHISVLADKYDIPLFVNEDGGGIASDWNFAYSRCETPYVTIAHQDDVYFPGYSHRAVSLLEDCDRPLIYFSDYCEIRDGKRVRNNTLLTAKRLLLLFLRPESLRDSRTARRISLSLGNGICCPAVTFAAENLPDVIFSSHFRTNLDWEAWEMLSEFTGSFIYDSKIGMGHRVHADSETSAMFRENGRVQEDYEMFKKFWPDMIARLLANAYSGGSEKSNRM